MVRLRRIAPDCGAELFGKLEAYNPAGSVKDRIGVAMIDAAEAEGRIEPGPHHDRRGHLGQHRHRAGLRVRGARLRARADDAAGHEPRARERCCACTARAWRSSSRWAAWTRRWRRRDGSPPSAATASSRTSSRTPPTPRSTGARPPRRSGATSTGASTRSWPASAPAAPITGAGERLKERNPELHVVAVEPKSSPVLSGGPPGPHKIQGIGAGFVPAVLNREVIDEIVTVDDEDAIETARLCAAARGRARGDLGRRGAVRPRSRSARAPRCAASGSSWSCPTRASATSAPRSSRPDASGSAHSPAWPARCART